MEMNDTMRTITFVGFSLTIITVEDMIKEIPHISNGKQSGSAQISSPAQQRLS